jgi:uncharacterized protein (DUF427 family)
MSAGDVAPSPRRVRVILAGRTVVDTLDARYVWEHPHYPRYYVPLADIDAAVLVDENGTADTQFGPAGRFGLQVGERRHPGSVAVFTTGKLAGLAKIDPRLPATWLEEDEQIFVHPRNPYTRVDALRSTRTVRIELRGVILAECHSPVLVFETGLPTRHYLNRADVDFTHLLPSETVTSCPYKGTTSEYWSVRLGDKIFADLAWVYQFPTREVSPIAGMVAFYDEKVDVFVDGRPVVSPDNPGAH